MTADSRASSGFLERAAESWAGPRDPRLPSRFPARLRRLPGRALLHGLRPAARLGLCGPPAARRLGGVARSAARRRVPPRAARGLGAVDGAERLARGPDRGGHGRRGLRARARGPRHRVRADSALARQHLLDERLRPPHLGAAVVDPGARALGRPRAALAAVRRRGRPRPAQQDQRALPRRRPRRRARAGAPLRRLPLAPFLGGRVDRLRALPAAPRVAARARLAHARVHGERPPREDGPAVAAAASSRARSTRPCRSRGCGCRVSRGCWWRGGRRGSRRSALPSSSWWPCWPWPGRKPYYLAAAYSLAFAAGAVCGRGVRPRGAPGPCGSWPRCWSSGSACWPRRSRGPSFPKTPSCATPRPWARPPGTDERHAVGRLTQFFADMHGWRELAEATARVVHELPAGDRAGLCVFGQNYGEAGAIDLLRPPARPAARDLLPQQLLALGGGALLGPRARRDRRPARAPGGALRAGRRAGVSRCQDCMPYENGLSLWVVRGPRRPLAEIWPQLKRFI